MPQLVRVGRAHTETVYTDDRGNAVARTNTAASETHVKYHGKHTACFNADFIRLKNHGQMTMTTKTRMNQASNQFRLGYRVYSRTRRVDGVTRRDWFVWWRGTFMRFTDGLILNREIDGLLIPTPPRRLPLDIDNLIHAQRRTVPNDFFGVGIIEPVQTELDRIHNQRLNSIRTNVNPAMPLSRGQRRTGNPPMGTEEE